MKTRMASQRHIDEIPEKAEENQENNQQKSNDGASSPLASPSTSQDNPSDDRPASAAESPRRSSSPEANCSICLGNLENKSFTDSCFHQFCFVCLLEWSKVKAECPLCKQPFKSIIHNVRSFEDYDQYHLRPRAEEQARMRFRYRTTMAGESWMIRHRRAWRQHQQEQLQRPSRTTARTLWREGRQAATSDFRRRMYQRNMRVEEVQAASGRRNMRFRNVTPEFFSRNPACSHRLVPWLNRELNVLLRNDANHVQFVLDLILGLIKRFEIRSEEFRQHLVSLLHRRTDHFIHEFYHFARSPYDLISYDQHAVYTDPRDADIQELSSDSDSERDQIIPNPYDNTVVDLSRTNTMAPMDPVVIDNSVVVLDSDDEEVRPSTSGLSRAAPVDLSNVAPVDLSNPVPIDLSNAAPVDLTNTSAVDLTNTTSASVSLGSAFRNVPAAGMYDDLLMDYAGTTSAGWDNPLRGTSSLINMRAFISSISNMFNNIYGPSTSTGGATAPPRRRQRSRSRSSAHTIDSDVDSIASSHSSDLMVTAVEKPWKERSPIPLSSGEETHDNTETKPTIKKKSKKKESHSKKKDRHHDKDKHRKEREGGSREKEKAHKKHKHKKREEKEKRRREWRELREERRKDGREERRRDERLDEGSEDRRRDDRLVDGRQERRRRTRALTISSEDSDVIVHSAPIDRQAWKSDYIPFWGRPGRYKARQHLFANVRDWMEDIPPINPSSRSRSRSRDPGERATGKTSRSHGASSSQGNELNSQHSSNSRDRSSRSRDRFSSPNKRRSRSRERRSASHDRSSRSHDGTRFRRSRSRERCSASRDRSQLSREHYYKSRDRPGKSQDRYSSSHGDSSMPEAHRSRSRDRLYDIGSKQKPSKTSSKTSTLLPRYSPVENRNSHKNKDCDNSLRSRDYRSKPCSKSSKPRDKHSRDKYTKSYHSSANEQSGDGQPSSDESYANSDPLRNLPKGKRKRDPHAIDNEQSKRKQRCVDKHNSDSECADGSVKSPAHSVPEIRDSDNREHTSASSKEDVQDGEVTSSNRATCSHIEESGKDASTDDTETYYSPEQTSSNHENHDATNQNSCTNKLSPKRTHICDSHSDTELREKYNRDSSEQNGCDKLSNDVEQNCGESCVSSKSDGDKSTGETKEDGEKSARQSDPGARSSSSSLGRDLVKFKIFKKNPTGHKKTALKTTESKV